MEQANINKTVDTKYKNGFVLCNCGYKKELGDGFNQHYIDNCPNCTAELTTINQRKVIYGGNKCMTADIGTNIYFVISNGIHVRYSFSGRSYYNLSIQSADKL